MVRNLLGIGFPFIIVIFILFLKFHFLTVNTSRLIVGCLRTRNAGKYMKEYLDYHFRIGFTEIHLYDDSDWWRYDTLRVKPDMSTTSQRYHYHDRRGLNMSKETDYLAECFRSTVDKYGDVVDGLIFSLDDDEFFVHEHLQEEFFIDGVCKWAPVKFFGSVETYGGVGTLDTFLHREKTVREDTGAYKYFRNQHTEHSNVPTRYLSYRVGQNKISLSPTKAIFSLTNTTKLLNSIYNGRRSDYIHGFTTSCERDDYVWLVHHTRSKKELEYRMRTFWKHIGNRNQRFTGSKSFTKRYLKERDRNEEFDPNVRNILETKLLIK